MFKKIGNIIALLIKNENLQKFFYNKKVEQNVSYIEKNKLKVVNMLKNNRKQSFFMTNIFMLLLIINSTLQK